MSDWQERLTGKLEPILGLADPRPAISAYHDMPYAIFCYRPEDELAVRQEVARLTTRLEQLGKRVTIVSLAECLAEAIDTVAGSMDALADAEREHGLEPTISTVHEILSEIQPLDVQVVSDIYYTLALAALGCTADSRAAADLLGDEVEIGPAFAPIVHAPVSEALPVVARALAAGRPLAQRPWVVARFMANNLRHRPALVQAHCEVAQLLAQRLLLGQGVVESLGCIFERWDGAGMPRRLRGEAIPLPARIAHLTYDIELFQRTEGPATSTATIRRRVGGAFDPRLVQVFVDSAGSFRGNGGRATAGGDAGR